MCLCFVCVTNTYMYTVSLSRCFICCHSLANKDLFIYIYDPLCLTNRCHVVVIRAQVHNVSECDKIINLTYFPFDLSFCASLLSLFSNSPITSPFPVPPSLFLPIAHIPSLPSFASFLHFSTPSRREAAPVNPAEGVGTSDICSS